MDQHSVGRKQKKYTKNIYDPVKFINECHTKYDHQGTKDDGTQNPPEQHFVLILLWNGERRKNNSNYKHIVNAQGKLYKVTCNVLKNSFIGSKICWIFD